MKLELFDFRVLYYMNFCVNRYSNFCQRRMPLSPPCQKRDGKLITRKGGLDVIYFRSDQLRHGVISLGYLQIKDGDLFKNIDLVESHSPRRRNGNFQ